MTSQRIFIAYRHEDEAHAGRVYDHLQGAFGEGRVFRDFDDSSWSTVSELREIVGRCGAVVAIVGPGWLERKGDLTKPGDPLRAELEEALENQGISLIPVLVGGAKMPEPASLPKRLAPFPDYRAVPLYPQYFSAGLADLTERLRARLEDGSEGAPTVPPSEGKSWVERATLWLALGVVALMGAGYFASEMDVWPFGPSTVEPDEVALDFDNLTDTQMLALTIWSDARGASAEVQQGVANVVMNRVQSGDFPDTVRGVLQQRGQFFVWQDGSQDAVIARQVDPESAAYRNAERFAAEAIAGELYDVSRAATYYAVCDLVPVSYRGKGLIRTARIHDMCFFAPQTEPPAPSDDAKAAWLALAVSEAEEWRTVLKDETTTRGIKRIQDYFTATDFSPAPGQTPAWAGAFVAWVMAKSGYDVPAGPASALNWKNFGRRELATPQLGAITILSSPMSSASGHVGFFAGFIEDGARVLILGGNTDNTVKVAPFDADLVISYRWPE